MVAHLPHPGMNREGVLAELRRSQRRWDVIVVGGGATGLGTALEAATRGYSTLLLEGNDFAKATSSRSTKLVHGGVRYLQQGNVSLVMEALRERGRLLANAPHICRNLPFVVPVYDWWDGPFYGVGMKLYDLLAGKLGLGPSRILSREETLALLPNVERKGLKHGISYFDGQFDDARLAICLAASIVDAGGTVLNHAPVTGFRMTGGQITGVDARCAETGERLEFDAKVVVNATGIFSDEVRRMADPGAEPMLALSQGTHIVLDRSFLPGDTAILVPKTEDGRVLFALPWHGRVVVGTTDVPVERAELEPRPQADELAFLLEHAARYLDRDPQRADIKSQYSGQRPLVRAGADKGTAALSRDHVLTISDSNLVSIVGGKWTTYRKMAEDVVDAASLVGGLPERTSTTHDHRLHGWTADPRREAEDPLAMYGADEDAVRGMMAERPDWSAPLHPELPYALGEVAWAVRAEMARTVEDVLARRTRALLLDAKASMEAAPAVAALMAAELGRDDAWQAEQVAAYHNIAKGYLAE